jgi:hypothetical protein
LPTRKSWINNEYEGKLLRYAINKLAKKLKKTEDTEDIIKITNAISTAANSKLALVKYEVMDDKIDLLMTMLKSRELKKYVEENVAKELPGAED